MDQQPDSSKEFDASSSTSSTSTMKPERFSCTECFTRRDPKRQWLLATSILLNLIFTIAAIVLLIVLFAPIPSFSSALIPHPNTTDPSTHRNITTPHADRQSPTTTCLLGITESEMYTFINFIGSRSYPGETCQQVHQQGRVPYPIEAYYEVAVAPEGFPRVKRNDFSNVNDGFGPEHAHWRPATEEERREIEDRAGPSSAPNHPKKQYRKRSLSGGAIGGIVASAVLIGILASLIAWDACCR